MEKSRHTAGELVEIFARETLQADMLARLHRMSAWQIGQHFHVAKNVATREISAAGGTWPLFLHDLNHATIDDVKCVGVIAGGIDFLLRLDVLHLRERAERPELDRLQRRAKRKEVPVWH